MVSGTLANARRAAKKKEDNFKRIEASAKRAESLCKNREEIIAAVCSLFGWSQLDPFARKMIDKTMSGKLVDIKKLKADIKAWKKSKTNGDNANGDSQTK